MSTAQQRLGEARASLFAAETAVAEEGAAARKQQLIDAVAEVRRIEDQIKEQGQRFVMARQHAETLWAKRAMISNSLRALDDALGEFPLPLELERYERKRSALVEEFQLLSRQISEASIPVAQGQDTIDKLTWVKHRAEIGVSDLRLAVREAKTGARQRF